MQSVAVKNAIYYQFRLALLTLSYLLLPRAESSNLHIASYPGSLGYEAGLLKSLALRQVLSKRSSFVLSLEIQTCLAHFGTRYSGEISRTGGLQNA